MTDCIVCESHISFTKKNVRVLTISGIKHLVCNTTCLANGQGLEDEKDLETSKEPTGVAETNEPSTLSPSSVIKKRAWSEIKSSASAEVDRKKNGSAAGQQKFLLDLPTSARLALEVTESLDLAELKTFMEIMGKESDQNALIQDANQSLHPQYILKLESKYRDSRTSSTSKEGRMRFNRDLTRTIELGANALRKKLELPLDQSSSSNEGSMPIKKSRSWAEIKRDG